jgi:hypothetical protein
MYFNHYEPWFLSECERYYLIVCYASCYQQVDLTRIQEAAATLLLNHIFSQHLNREYLNHIVKATWADSSSG